MTSGKHSMHSPGHNMGNQEDDAQQQEERKRARARTEAEANSIDGKAGRSGKSSHDHMSNVKAGTHEGAGGGTKAKRNH
jgi:hypothetical protein